MEQLTLNISEKSRTRIIASSPLGFQIELMEYVGGEDIPTLVEVSESLASEYGDLARLTKTTIQSGEIVGYIIGIPLEYFARDPWAKFDQNLGQNNTLYTYAYVILARYRGNGFARTLKRVYLNWARKHNYRYITGHVLEGIARNFSPDTAIVKRFPNWHGSGRTFEYYRRPIRNSTAGRDF
ncbi:MAG: GNAT family N-acetyltransferase [Calditrichaeota bacterium]|nr:GNAT family N-acetyltransferase [Calditrichota bacterium]